MFKNNVSIRLNCVLGIDNNEVLHYSAILKDLLVLYYC